MVWVMFHLIYKLIVCMKILQKWVRMMDEQTIKRILQNPKCDEKCELLHAGDCNLKAAIQFIMGVKNLYKIYLLAHIIPLLLFKFKSLRKNPRKELWKLFVGIVNSLMFAGLSTAIVRRCACLLTKYVSYDFTIAHYPASIAGISLLFESPARQAEITLYCVSKSMDTAYRMLKHRGYSVTIPCGNLWINGVSLAVLAFAFYSDPTLFREGYRKLWGILIGDI